MLLFDFLLIILASVSVSTSIQPYDLPVLPDVLHSFSPHEANLNGKRIPRHLWVAFKDIPPRENMSEPLRKMIERNEKLNWTMHLADNQLKLDFMERYYANTSLLWAYKMINPAVGNAAADIWRYGLLYMFGGLYMDDDSYFEATFDEVNPF